VGHLFVRFLVTQGDQIGRIFSYGVVVYVGQFFKLTEVGQLIFPRYKLTIDLNKNGLGYILGDFFTNSSGHTGCRRDIETIGFDESGLHSSEPRPTATKTEGVSDENLVTIPSTFDLQLLRVPSFSNEN
jgi:hypothetical protein